MVRRLLVRERIADDLRLLPRPAKYLQALRQSLAEEATRHRDCRPLQGTCYEGEPAAERSRPCARFSALRTDS